MTAKITSSSRAVKARVGSTWRLRHEGRLREQFCALPGHPFRRLRNHLSARRLLSGIRSSFATHSLEKRPESTPTAYALEA